MYNIMSCRAGFGFAGNKILVSIFAAFGLLLAAPALAAATAPLPSPTGTTIVQSGTAITQGSAGILPGGQTQSTGAMRAMPCVMMNQTGGQSNMMYRTSPCGTPVYAGYMGYNGFGPGAVSWFGIMFVVTVVLVWGVLLLLMALLWKMLQKHKRG